MIPAVDRNFPSELRLKPSWFRVKHALGQNVTLLGDTGQSCWLQQCSFIDQVIHELDTGMIKLSVLLWLLWLCGGWHHVQSASFEERSTSSKTVKWQLVRGNPSKLQAHCPAPSGGWLTGVVSSKPPPPPLGAGTVYCPLLVPNRSCLTFVGVAHP